MTEDTLRRWYPTGVLAGAMGFMLFVRLQAMDAFARGDRFYFAGNDAYYHFRQVVYVVHHWPATMPFDPWTYFPHGTAQGQFGTLFDQLIATAALIVGGGSQSEYLIAQTVMVAPAVFGTLVAIPSYCIARHLAGRRAGVVAVVVLALIPGTFLRRGLVGFADHNIAEVLFQAIAVFAFMHAIHIAERDHPVYELLIDRDWSVLWPTTVASVVAGIALFLYVWVWPPAAVLTGLVGVFFLVAMSVHVVRGRSPEALAVVGVVSMATLSVLQLAVLDGGGIATTRITALQVGISAGVGVATLSMGWLARLWDGRGLAPRGYPVAIAAGVGMATTAVAVVRPGVFALVVSNLHRTFAAGQSRTVRTIAEAQPIPPGSAFGYLFQQYGFAFLVGVAGLGMLAAGVATTRRYAPERLLVVVWAVGIWLMAVSQVRFNYYLAVVVAVTAAYAVARALAFINLPDHARDLEAYQAISLLILAILVLGPMTPPIAAGADTCGQPGAPICHAVATGQRTGPGSVTTWASELDWLAASTPAEGTYGGATNRLDYYGRFERTDDFAYPEGAYGVLSWWDYGHWITVEGERIPTANPFQQGASRASAYLLAESETRANLMLDVFPALVGSPADHSTADLRAVAAGRTDQQTHEATRYVMIDDQMAAGKFWAIATWTGPGGGAYIETQPTTIGETTAHLPRPNARYHDTMLARLYLHDARGLRHYRLVHESGQSAIASVARRTQRGLEPTGFINRRVTQSVYATVQQRPDLVFYAGRQVATVKTFERVAGARLTGEAPPNASVTAAVRLETNQGRRFVYVQTTHADATGRFELVVPYATTNTVGPKDGGTDTGVVATGPYTVFVGPPSDPQARANVTVPEPAIYNGDAVNADLSDGFSEEEREAIADRLDEIVQDAVFETAEATD